MNAIKALAIWVCMLISLPIDAQQKYPPLTPPSPSSPQIVAFMAWHQSLLKDDFVAYKNVSFWLPEMKEDMKRQIFDRLRSTTPAIVKITEQKANPNGSVGFYAVGCKDDVRLFNVITVGISDGVWRVAASGWGPPWNETAKLCPV